MPQKAPAAMDTDTQSETGSETVSKADQTTQDESTSEDEVCRFVDFILYSVRITLAMYSASARYAPIPGHPEFTTTKTTKLMLNKQENVQQQFMKNENSFDVF